MTGKFDAQQAVTDRIIAAIEAGTPPWRKPWTGDRGGAAFPMRACGEPYRGINVILLWLEADAKGYTSPFGSPIGRRRSGRAGAEGREVLPGHQVRHVRRRQGRGGGGRGRRRRKGMFTKLYNVFNADQIDGLPESYYRRPEPARDLGTEPDAELRRSLPQPGCDRHQRRSARLL